MTLYMPPALRWLGWVAGSSWPDGDEDAMWSIANSWKTASTALAALEPQVVQAQKDTEQAYTQGAGADAMGAKFDNLIDGDQSVKALAEMLDEVYNSAFDMGTQLQATKITIILSLAWLAMEIMWAWLFPPTAPAVEAAAVTTTRSILKVFEDYVQNVIERLAGKLGASTTKSRYLFKEMVESGTFLRLPSAKGFGVYSVKALESAGVSALMDGSVQLGQIAAGKRHGFDWKEFGVSMAASVAGAAPGREAARYLGDGIDKYLGSDLAKMNLKVGNITYPAGAVIRGATIGIVSGAVSTVFGDMVGAAAYGSSVFTSAQGWVGGMARGGIVGAARGTFIQRTAVSGPNDAGETEQDFRSAVWAKSAPSNKVSRTSRPTPDTSSSTDEGEGSTTGGGGSREEGGTEGQDDRAMMSGALGGGGTDDQATTNSRAGVNDAQGNPSGGVRSGGQDQPQGSSSGVRSGAQDEQQGMGGGGRNERSWIDMSDDSSSIRSGSGRGDESSLDLGDESSPNGGRGLGNTGGGLRGGVGGQDQSTALGPRATGSGLGGGRSQLGGDGSSAPIRRPGVTQSNSGAPSALRPGAQRGLAGLGRSDVQSGQNSAGGVRAGSQGDRSWLDMGSDSSTSGDGAQGSTSGLQRGAAPGQDQTIGGTTSGGGGGSRSQGNGEQSWLDLSDDSTTTGGGRGEDGTWLDSSDDGSSVSTGGYRGGDEASLDSSDSESSVSADGRGPGQSWLDMNDDTSSVGSVGGHEGGTWLGSNDDGSSVSAGGGRGGHGADESWLDMNDDASSVGSGGRGRDATWLDPSGDESSAGAGGRGGRGPGQSWLDMDSDQSSPIRTPRPSEDGLSDGGSEHESAPEEAPPVRRGQMLDKDFLGKATDMKAKTRPKRHPEPEPLPGPFEAPTAPSAADWLPAGATGSGGGSTAPEGSNPTGSNPQGTNPQGTNPEGTNPGGTNPGGTDPGGTDPEGTGSTTGAGIGSVDVPFTLGSSNNNNNG